MKRGDYALHRGKTSPYLSQNELHFAFKRKNSAYLFLLVGLPYYGKDLGSETGILILSLVDKTPFQLLGLDPRSVKV